MKLTPLCLALALGCAQAAEDDDLALALAYGDQATVVVAAGYKQSRRQAPAVTTVITADDIQAMGATDLSQVLERVAGLHVSRSFYMQDPLYQLRGIQSDFSQQMLILIDGIRRQSPVYGGPEEIWISMPVEHIARIEVMRGPGSALYGADAFAGVIAITTWRGAERPGTHLQVRSGSYNERSGSLQHGAQLGDWQWFAYLRLGRTDGQNEQISADAQSGLDALFGTQASLAPGSLHMPHDDVDAVVNLGWREWTVNASAKLRRGVGSGTGIAQALTHSDRVDSRLSTLAVTYENPQWLSDWGLKTQLSLLHTDIDSVMYLFPAGAFGGAFPNGMVGTPGRSSRSLAAESVATYQGWRGHHLRLGGGALRISVDAARERKNFNFVSVPGIGYVPVPIGPLTDVPPEQRYMTPHQRTLQYLLAQDEWQLAKDWTLTLGLRHDRYSDFGHTTNPRAALIWAARHDLTLKMLHGHAFRAPSFTELYTVNNPVTLGDPTNQPEKLTNTEWVVDWQPTPTLQGSLNLFQYRWNDRLQLQANADGTATNRNGGGQTAHGFELEARWQFNPSWRLDGSVATQHAIDSTTQLAVAQTPRRLIKLGVHAQLAAAWALHAKVLHVGGRMRAASDSRPPIKDFTTLDVSLQWNRNAQKTWWAQLALRNLTNRDAREPSPAPGSIPNDFPLPGRTWTLELGYGF